MILYYFSCLFWKAKLSYNIMLPVYRLVHAQEFKEQPSFSPSSLLPFIKTYIIYVPYMSTTRYTLRIVLTLEGCILEMAHTVVEQI